MISRIYCAGYILFLCIHGMSYAIPNGTILGLTIALKTSIQQEIDNGVLTTPEAIRTAIEEKIAALPQSSQNPVHQYFLSLYKPVMQSQVLLDPYHKSPISSISVARKEGEPVTIYAAGGEDRTVSIWKLDNGTWKVVDSINFNDAGPRSGLFDCVNYVQTMRHDKALIIGVRKKDLTPQSTDETSDLILFSHKDLPSARNKGEHKTWRRETVLRMFGQVKACTFNSNERYCVVSVCTHAGEHEGKIFRKIRNDRDYELTRVVRFEHPLHAVIWKSAKFFAMQRDNQRNIIQQIPIWDAREEIVLSRDMHKELEREIEASSDFAWSAYADGSNIKAGYTRPTLNIVADFLHLNGKQRKDMARWLQVVQDADAGKNEALATIDYEPSFWNKFCETGTLEYKEHENE